MYLISFIHSSIHSWYLSMSFLRYQIIHPSIHYIWVCPFSDTRLFIHPFMQFEYVLAQIPGYSSIHSWYLSISSLRYQVIHPFIHDIWVSPRSDTRLFIHSFMIIEYVLAQIPGYSSIHSWYLSMSFLRYQIIHPSIHYIWVCPCSDTRLFIHPFIIFEYVLSQIPDYSSIHSCNLSMSFLRYQIIHPSIHYIWVCAFLDTRLFIHSFIHPFMLFEYVLAQIPGYSSIHSWYLSMYKMKIKSL